MVMIIVTLGIMLVIGTLAVANGELSKGNKGKSLDSACQSLLDQFLSDEDIFVESGVLDFASIETISPSMFSVGYVVTGYRLMLAEVYPNTCPVILAKNGTIPVSLEELHTARMPVNVRHSSTDIRAALVSVWVW